MKSERAKQHIAHNVFRVDNDTFLPLVITRDNCNKAVELAEQDAEQRMREKAIKAYCSECTCYETGACALDPDKCATKLLFVQNMNEE